MRVFGLIIIAALSCAAVAQANVLEQSLRPAARPVVAKIPAPQIVPAVTQSVRPIIRPASLSTSKAVVSAAKRDAAADRGLQRWVKGFRSRALSAGIKGSVFDRAFKGVRYDANIISRDRNQSEFTKTIWEYLDSAASDKRIANGKEALNKHSGALNAIEARYGVEKEVVAAVWGLESAFGAHRGDTNIIEALATLSYDGRRGKFFEAQLIAALRILQSGDTTPGNMTGSWAGAMGHTQFIPTSYLAYAVDFTGDGRRDIWSDDPSDALASTAAYLAKFGWQKGVPWGVEVTIPKSFNYALASRKTKKTPSQWAKLGVVGMDGAPIPNYGPGSILLPGGAQGAAFMVFKNFSVLERYNAADAYVIGVGHLSDRLKGQGPIKASWPRGDRALTSSERREMQRRLTAAGFNTRGVDGRIGPRTIAAVRAFQRTQGMAPDGYASLSVLKKLR